MRLRTIIGGGAAVLFAVVSTVGCSSLRHLAESNPKAGISLPKHAKQDIDAAKAALANKKKNDSEIIVTTTDGKQRTFIPTENVSIDDDGNMLIDGQAIEAVTISARNKFRNLVERNGKISIEFIVTVPDTLLARDWQLVLNPMLIEGQGNTPYPLDPLVYRGDKFGRMQNHEYDSYEQQRNGLLGDLRRYVLTTDNIVARNITYTPDANDQFDHLKDYLAPRFRYDSIDVLPGAKSSPVWTATMPRMRVVCAKRISARWPANTVAWLPRYVVPMRSRFATMRRSAWSGPTANVRRWAPCCTRPTRPS